MGGAGEPSPWARGPEISFLASADELGRRSSTSRFRVLAWPDTTAPSRAWFRERAAALAAGTRPALGFHLLPGPDARQMFSNQVRNLEEDRIALVQTLAEAS